MLIERTGYIFAITILIQNYLINTLILFNHPRLINKINSQSGLLPRIFVKERYKYLDKTFTEIFDEFVETFDIDEDSDFYELLFFSKFCRNCIGHCHLTAHTSRNYITFKPKNISKRRKEINKVNKILGITRKNGIIYSSPTTYLLRLGDDGTYTKILSAFRKLEDEHLEPLAIALGINHQMIT